MNTEQLMSDFKQSVHKLADNLPQWSSEDKNRRRVAAISSMFEECGEICGLISKYQTRNVKGVNLWKTKIDLDSISDDLRSTIISKFVDETGDFLWVFTAATHCVFDDKLDVCDMVKVAKKILKNKQNLQELCDEYFVSALMNDDNDNNNDDEYTLGVSILSEIMNGIYILPNYSSYSDSYLNNIAIDFCYFLAYLKLKYNISLDDILLHNMEKLGIRYDENGNRLDGKL